MSYDPKCFMLALQFLQDHPDINTHENAQKLAQEIQTTIEDWIEDAASNLNPVDSNMDSCKPKTFSEVQTQ